MATVEESTQKVQRMLVEGFGDIILTKDGFAVERGSTRVNIEVKDWGKDNKGDPSSIVRIWAPLVRELKPTPEFYRWAAVDGSRFLFGSVSVIENEGSRGLLRGVRSHRFSATTSTWTSCAGQSRWCPERPTTWMTWCTRSSAASGRRTSSRAMDGRTCPSASASRTRPSRQRRPTPTRRSSRGTCSGRSSACSAGRHRPTSRPRMSRRPRSRPEASRSRPPG